MWKRSKSRIATKTPVEQSMARMRYCMVQKYAKKDYFCRMIGTELHIVRKQHLEALSSVFSRREAEQLMRVLLEDLFGIDWKQQLMCPDLTLDVAQCRILEDAVAELLTGKPVQYVTGVARFDDLSLKVNPSVLIPRPETEEMVQKIAASSIAPKRIWDVGTGSGCIAIALAKRFPEAELVAFDVSSAALATAQANAEMNAAVVRFVCDDVLAPQSDFFRQPVDLVVSNPPYICERERVTMLSNVLDYESETALFVPDADPLLFYRQILLLARPCLNTQGVVWFEINEAMGEAMMRLCREMGYSHAEILLDFAEKPRFCVAHL